MQNINEVFAKLDARLDKLKHFDASISVWDVLDNSFSISDIERNVHRFPQECTQRIDIALREIEELESRGVAILDKAEIHDEWLYGGVPLETSTTIKQKRKEVYSSISNELKFYKEKLGELRKPWEGQIPEDIPNKRKYTIVIGEDYKLPQLKADNPDISEKNLSKEQTALLFNYLKQKELILPYDATSLSKIASLVSGFSEKTLRQDVFTNIHEIKSKVPGTQRKSAQPVSNIQLLKKALISIIDQIDIDSKASSKKVTLE